MWQRTKNVYHLFIAILANILQRFPSRRLLIIGVTGTDGKTTTTSLIYHILKTAGMTVSMVSTVEAIIHGKSFDTGFHVTNPSSFPLQKFLRSALISDTYEKNYMVLEITSHGLDQHRAWGIPFTVGVLTNITHEHLDYHKTYENYVKTKVKLLKRSKIAVVNKDDNSYSIVVPHLSHKKVITYGLTQDADITLDTFPFTTQLFGVHNKYNILAAAAACKALGIADDIIRMGVATFTPPIGRGEIVYDKDFTVMIDFAHTPNALEQMLVALNKMKKTNTRVITVTGAEGYRDPNKRPKMGEVATRLSDTVIITAVDPRGLAEDINSQILKGAMVHGKLGNVIIENDRQKAIELAISMAKKGDIVGIFGKGHELSMNYDGKKEVPWSDYEAVKKALAKKTET